MIKGNLAHNSYLVLISCLLDMIKNSITEKSGEKKYMLLQGKENQILDPLYILGFPISVLLTSLKGEFPLNKKECLCVITICMSNQITKKI